MSRRFRKRASRPRRFRRELERHRRCNGLPQDRKSTRLNSSHSQISYAVFCLKKKKHTTLRGRQTYTTNYHLTINGVAGLKDSHPSLARLKRQHLCTRNCIVDRIAYVHSDRTT